MVDARVSSVDQKEDLDRQVGRKVLESFGELMHDRVESMYAEDVLRAGMLANAMLG